MNINALRELWEKTTPGEWVIDDHIVNRGDTPDMWHVYEFLEDDPPLATMPYLNAEANARFLAAAHNEMGKLLDVVEERDAEIERLRSENAALMVQIRRLQSSVATLANFDADEVIRLRRDLDLYKQAEASVLELTPGWVGEQLPMLAAWVAKIERERDRLREERDRLVNRSDDLSRELEEARSANDRYDRAIKEFETNNEILRARVAECEGALRGIAEHDKHSCKHGRWTDCNRFIGDIARRVLGAL